MHRLLSSLLQPRDACSIFSALEQFLGGRYRQNHRYGFPVCGSQFRVLNSRLSSMRSFNMKSSYGEAANAQVAAAIACNGVAKTSALPNGVWERGSENCRSSV